MDTTRARHRRLVAALALGALLPLGIAACGDGGATADAVASLGDGQTADPASDDSRGELTEEERRQAMLDFAQCMREHGIDMPDPQFDEQGRGGVMIGGAGGGRPDEDTLRAARDACEPLMEDVIAQGERSRDPEQEEEMKERALAFAKCMREHGVDMPDPQFESGGRMTQALSIDPDDPAFQSALEECRDGDGPFVFGGGARSGEGGQ